MGLLTVSLGLSQHVSGLGVTMLCTGLSFYLYRLIFGQPSQPPHVHLRDAGAPRLADLPWLGPVLFDQFAWSISPSCSCRSPPSCSTTRPGGSVSGRSARTRTRRSRPA